MNGYYVCAIVAQCTCTTFDHLGTINALDFSAIINWDHMGMGSYDIVGAFSQDLPNTITIISYIFPMGELSALRNIIPKYKS